MHSSRLFSIYLDRILIAVACVVVFLFSAIPVKADAGCCLYFTGSGPFDSCFAEIDVAEGKTTEADEFSCKTEGDPIDYKAADIFPTNFVGADILETSDASCASVAGYTHFKITKPEETLGAFKINKEEWCGVGKELLDSPKWFPNFKVNLKSAKELYPPDPVDVNQYKGCCIYLKATLGAQVNTSQCLATLKYISTKDVNKSVVAPTCKDANTAAVKTAAAVPGVFEGGWAISKDKWIAPSGAASAPNCLKIDNYLVKQVEFKIGQASKAVQAYGVSGLLAEAPRVCAAGIEFVKKDVTELGKLHDSLEKVAEAAEGVEVEVQKYLDSKKSGFCCIPKKKTTETACYVPHVYANAAEGAKYVITAAKLGANKTTEQILDGVFNKSKFEFASAFYSCVGQVQSNKVTKQVSDFQSLMQSVQDIWTDSHYLVWPGCNDKAFPPGHTKGEPCDAFSKQTCNATSEFGIEVPISEWCAEPNYFCACKAGFGTCIKEPFIGKVSTKGASKDLPADCVKAAQSKGSGWKCLQVNAKDIKTIGKSASGFVFDCTTQVKKDCECANGTKKSLPLSGGPELQEKQCCKLCQDDKVSYKGKTVDCATTIKLPAIKSFASINPVKPSTPQTFIGTLIKAFLGIIGSVALGLIVYGGVVWMTSAGISDRIETGKKTILWALLGLVVVFISYAVMAFVFSIFG